MVDKREYKININPTILELLGPSLYTNIYYVLAELIANSYDANASNIYIIEKEDAIIVEDDGDGMSYTDGDINKYLNVALETRTSKEEIYTDETETRKKIGRKGIGKLAALSVSENVLVMTKKNGEKSGFVLSRHVDDDHLLKPIKEEDISFEQEFENGTSIVMTAPQYGMNKTVNTIKSNILKIFPLVNKDFKIHIINKKGQIVVDSFDEEMIVGLSSLIILGEEYRYLSEHFDSNLENKEEANKKLLNVREVITKTLLLTNKDKEQKDYELEIKGWVGAYRTTRDRKKNPGDFPDNFLSLLSNGKLGEYNILSHIGKNRLQEVYIVGQLHVDLFEETELPDMALSNRQGYKSDDERYQFVLKTVSETLLPEIVKLRKLYGDFKRQKSEETKLTKLREKEEELRKSTDEFKSTVSRHAAIEIAKFIGNKEAKGIEDLIASEMNQSMSLMGLKGKIDSKKKKLLICHTEADENFANVVYKMLTFNNLDKEDIIYSSSTDDEATLPNNTNVFNYLRDFFVKSYSNQQIYVLYVTSDDMANSWFAVTEVGAGWITESDHRIFTNEGHTPRRPLNTDLKWQTSEWDNNTISMKTLEFNNFISKIREVCLSLGCNVQSKTANEKELKRYVDII